MLTFFTLNVDKNRHLLTTYPPRLFHVIFERPLTETRFCVNYHVFERTWNSKYVDVKALSKKWILILRRIQIKKQIISNSRCPRAGFLGALRTLWGLGLIEAARKYLF